MAYETPNMLDVKDIYKPADCGQEASPGDKVKVHYVSAEFLLRNTSVAYDMTNRRGHCIKQALNSILGNGALLSSNKFTEFDDIHLVTYSLDRGEPLGFTRKSFMYLQRPV